MASVAQIHANQTNAKKSTGPRTPLGKARSSRNHATHGLASQSQHVSAAELPAFQAFTANLMRELAPRDAIELQAFNMLRDAAWRIRKIRSLYVELARRHGADPFSVPEAAAELRQLARYRASAEMRLYRAIRLLREAQQMTLARSEYLTQKENAELPPLLANSAMRVRECNGQRHNTADRRILERIAARNSLVRTQLKNGSAPPKPPPVSI